MLKLGADVACARWLIRTGAEIRLVGDSDIITSKRALRLAEKNANTFHIGFIDFSDSYVTIEGFDYLHGIGHVTEVKANFCKYLDDQCLRRLLSLSDSLRRLEIVFTRRISARGVQQLQFFKQLRRLHLYNLPAIDDHTRRALLQRLKTELPRCEVTFPKTLELSYGYRTVKKKAAYVGNA